MDNVKVIAVPVMGKSTEFKISKLFARSPYFMIFDEKNHSVEFVANNYKSEPSKSGQSMSKLLVAKGVNVFCGLEIGFNVQKIAEENNIQLILLPDNGKMTGEKIIELMSKK
jgi:predicted Fe-Mo cluster-binding NifX family protein